MHLLLTNPLFSTDVSDILGEEESYPKRVGLRGDKAGHEEGPGGGRGDHGLRCCAGQAEEPPAIADSLLPEFQDHLALRLHDQECRQCKDSRPHHGRTVKEHCYKSSVCKDQVRPKFTPMMGKAVEIRDGPLLSMDNPGSSSC